MFGAAPWGREFTDPDQYLGERSNLFYRDEVAFGERGEDKGHIEKVCAERVGGMTGDRARKIPGDRGRMSMLTERQRVCGWERGGGAGEERVRELADILLFPRSYLEFRFSRFLGRKFFG